jgi:hypothetical protein
MGRPQARQAGARLAGFTAVIMAKAIPAESAVYLIAAAINSSFKNSLNVRTAMMGGICCRSLAENTI